MVTDGVEFENVTVGVDGSSALHDVSFAVPRARSLGVLGPAGAGKTTIANVILGAVIPIAGLVRVMGKAPQPWAPAYRRTVVAAPVLDAQLSGMLELIRLLWSAPKVCVLDEPEAQLSARAAQFASRAIARVAARSRTTLIVLSRDAAVIERWCTDAIVLREGRLVARHPAGVRAADGSKCIEIVVQRLPDGIAERVAALATVTDLWADRDRMLVRYLGSDDVVLRCVIAGGARIVETRPVRSPLAEAYRAIVGDSTNPYRSDTIA